MNNHLDQVENGNVLIDHGFGYADQGECGNDKDHGVVRNDLVDYENDYVDIVEHGNDDRDQGAHGNNNINHRERCIHTMATMNE
jgi:hypothetical protein